jgi:hypothetical protein
MAVMLTGKNQTLYPSGKGRSQIEIAPVQQKEKSLIFHSGKSKIEGEPKYVVLLVIIKYGFVTVDIILGIIYGSDVVNAFKSFISFVF